MHIGTSNLRYFLLGHRVLGRILKRSIRLILHRVLIGKKPRKGFHLMIILRGWLRLGRVLGKKFNLRRRIVLSTVLGKGVILGNKLRIFIGWIELWRLVVLFHRRLGILYMGLLILYMRLLELLILLMLSILRLTKLIPRLCLKLLRICLRL
jgi:hypothetical protein